MNIYALPMVSTRKIWKPCIVHTIFPRYLDKLTTSLRFRRSMPEKQSRCLSWTASSQTTLLAETELILIKDRMGSE